MSIAAVTEIPPAPPRQKIRWRRALLALKQLLAEPDDTAKAQDLIMAIGGREFEREVQKFLASPSAPALLAERPCLLDALSDRAALERLPADSLGRAYLAYLDANGFDPRSLIQMARDTRARWEAEDGLPPLDEFRTWYTERSLLMHDLTHVLTDYGTDGAGEATLLAFTLAQRPGRASALLTFGAALELWRQLGPGWLRYDWRAWTRGRRAVWLWATPWEELLPMRLTTVRALLGIEATAAVHPQGVLRGDPNGAFHYSSHRERAA